MKSLEGLTPSLNPSFN